MQRRTKNTGLLVPQGHAPCAQSIQEGQPSGAQPTGPYAAPSHVGVADALEVVVGREEVLEALVSLGAGQPAQCDGAAGPEAHGGLVGQGLGSAPDSCTSEHRGGGWRHVSSHT